MATELESLPLTTGQEFLTERDRSAAQRAPAGVAG
jgi:hypothetical protein